MRVFSTVPAMQAFSQRLRRAGKRVGFVPTMGALHEGHLSLVRRALQENDAVVVSIYVNPAQFCPGEDFHAYPRTPRRDRRLLRLEGVHALFAPTHRAMYPEGFATRVQVDQALSRVLCGRYRPGHFDGVALVCAKLFNAVQPARAYFGRKDFQQAVLVQRMTRDLGFPLTLRVCPTVREKDGLAMSSRNAYLTPAQRAQAPLLYQALLEARRAFRAGTTSAAALKRRMRAVLRRGPLIRPQYTAIVDSSTLRAVPRARRGDTAALAAFLGRARLIDNLAL